MSNNVNNNNINNFNGENVVDFDDDTENFFDFVIYFLVMIITMVRNCVKYAFNLRDSGSMNEITITNDAFVDAESTYEYDDIFSVTNQTIPIVSEQTTMIAFVNDRYKDILLIDSGSCCNAISKSKVDEIRRVTNSQIPRIKCNVPKIVDVNGEKIETDGIVLLDVMLPNSKLMIRRIPFVILLVNSKFLFGTNTLKARGLSLYHEDGDSKLRCDSNPKKITDYHVDELQTDKKNIKIKYNKYDPIDITCAEEMEIPKGASMNLCCQVGVPIKSNLNKILYKVDKPFVEYMGYTSIMKKGKIYVALRNNGPTTVVQKESPIGYAYPIGNDDIDVNPIPTIANMTNELSQHDFYRVGCVCQIKEKWPQHKLVSFGIDARSTFFNYNKFDKMILDPDWTLNNKYLGYQDTVFPWGNNQESIFVIRDLYTLSIKQVTILTKVAERNEGMKILCVSFPHPGHIKVITNQLTIYLNSWLLFEVEDTWSFDELPNVIIESDTRFKDGIKTAFPSVKLMIHVPISKQNQMEYLNKLKDCIDAHFLYRRIVYRYQEDLVDKGTQDTYLLAGFQKAPLTGGTKPTKKCSKCVICRNKLPRPKHAPNQESIDAITTAPCESIMHDHRNKYTMFNDKRIANELNLIDNIEEELIKSQMETIKLAINNVTEEYDKDSELSITKLEDQCPDDIGGFDTPKPASNWRELINLDQTNKDSLKWLVPLLDEYADIIQMEKRQRGNLKLPFPYKIEFKSPDVPSFHLNSYPTPAIYASFLEKAIKSLLEDGVIEMADINSTAPAYYSPLFIRARNSKVQSIIKKAENENNLEEAVSKLTHESFRIILDVRLLNKNTAHQGNSTIHIKDILNCFADFTMVSAMDIAKGFGSLTLHPDSRRKLMFRFRNVSYQFLRPVEGLSGLPSHFQSVLSYVLKDSLTLHLKRDKKDDGWAFYGGKLFKDPDPSPPEHLKDEGQPMKERPLNERLDALLQDTICVHFMDDIYLISKEKEEDIMQKHHKELTESVFADLRKAGLLLSPSKLELCRTDSVTCLGYRLNPTGYEVIGDRTSLFKNAPLPMTKKELYSMTGCFSYLQNFSPQMNIKLAPLYGLIGRTASMRSRLQWTQEEKDCFYDLCKDMGNLKQLWFFDPRKTTFVSSDASHTGCGGVISQECGGGKRSVVHYWSKKFSKDIIKNMSSFEKEMLSIVYSVCTPNVAYFLSQSMAPVIIETDASSVVALCSMALSGYPKACRWTGKINSIPADIRFKHRPNSTFFCLPDKLSRAFENDKDDEPHVPRHNMKDLNHDQVTLPKSLTNKESFTLGDIEKEIKKNPHIVNNVKEPDEPVIKKKWIKPNPDKILAMPPKPMAVIELGQVWEMLAKEKENISWPNNTSGELFYTLREYNCSNIAEMQSNDAELSHMISKILTSEKNPYPRFRVLNGTLLCRLKRKNTKNPTINDYGIMLNTHSAVNIIAMIHSLNHAGSQTTMKMFKQYYATRSLKDIVKSISIACKHCSMFRLRNSSILQGFLNMSTSILETLVLDHVFLPPSIFNGLKYIGFLSICDEASRMHFSKPVRTEKTSEVAAILREVLSSLGEVKTIISDNATNLAKNKVIIDTCSSFGVKCRTILPYNSRGNGLIELQNKRMRHIVTTLAKMLNKPWPEVFGIAKITINSLPIGSIHNNAVVSPHELVYGKEPDIFHSLNKVFGFQDVSNIRRQKERKELEHFLKSQKEERIREYKARLEQTPMKHLREGALVLRQHTGDNYKKGFPKYMDDIFIIVDRNGLELKLQNFTNTNDTNIYRTHLRHVKIFTPRDIKYYQHLDPSMKRLLGHELDKDIIERARKAGELLPDYNKKKFEHLKVQMGKTNKPETIDLASDSDEPVFIPKTDNQSIIESKAFKDSLRRLKTEPPIKEEIEPHVKTEKWLTDHYNIQPRSNLHEKTIEPKVESSPKSWLNKSIDKLKRALSESPKSNHEPKSEAATSLTTKQESDQSNASTANREPLEEGIDEQPIYSRRLRQKPRIDYREWTRGYNKYNKPTKKK